MRVPNETLKLKFYNVFDDLHQSCNWIQGNKMERRWTYGINTAREFKERNYKEIQGLRLEFELGLGQELQGVKKLLY